MTYKQILLRCALCAEVGLYAYFYVTGLNGMKKIHALAEDTIKNRQTIVILKSDVVHLKNDIQDWNQYPWLREKIAREELQLAYPKEELFLTSKEKNV